MKQAAQKMCEIGRRAYQRGLLTAAEGNFSCRLDAQRILCTPTGLCKGLLTPEDLCVVDPAGKQLAGVRPVSSEIHLHLQILEQDATVAAVVHTHPPFATTFAVLGESVPDGLLPEGALFLGRVPLVAYETPGTEQLGRAVRPYVNDHVAAILQNHGAVSWGRDLESAYLLTETLEAVCRVAYQARLSGQPKPIPADKLRELTEIRRRMRAAPEPRA